MAKSTFDKKKEQISAEIDRVTDDVKDTAEDIGNWWTRSTTEEKITMIVGIILLVRALLELADIIWGIILLTLGLLAISGFFDRPLRDLLRYCKKEFSSKKDTISSTAKSVVKKSSKK